MENEWRYKIKAQHHRRGMSKGWLKCSADKIANVKRMFGDKYDYEEIKAPEPTPSMVVDEEKDITASTVQIAVEVLKKSKPAQKKKAKRKPKKKESNK